MGSMLVGKALKHQYKYIFSKAKYTALVSGLGAGKTEALIYRLLHFISNVKSAEVCVYQPTVDLTKKILYPRLEEIFGNSGILYKLNRTDGVMNVWTQTGKATITFKSMDTPHRIIGFQSMLSLIDEIDTMPEDKARDVWGRIMARNRKKFNWIDGRKGVNQIGVTTTPEGFKFMYKMWMKEHAGNPEYELIRGRTADNHHLPEDFVDTLRRTYPPQLARAYLEGEFVNLRGLTVYDGFEREKSNTNLTLKDFAPTASINIGLDANVGKMGAVVIMKGEGYTKQAFAVAEFHNVLDTPAMIRFIQARYPKRNIVVFPDSSMGSRKSVDASKTDIKLLREAGFKVNAPKKNGAVKDRVTSMNVLFKNGEGERNFFVNVDKCPNFVESLEKQIYDENGAPEKDNITDHLLDAAGYCIVRLWGIARPTASIARMRMGI